MGARIHLLNGPDGQRWYLYYVAGQQPYNLGTQRIHVLESAGLDPMGPYSFKADLLDPTQNNTWELDPSILPLNGQLYLLSTAPRTGSSTTRTTRPATAAT